MKVSSPQNSLSNGLNMYLKKPIDETQLTVTLLIGFVILFLQRTLELGFDILHKFSSMECYGDKTYNIFVLYLLERAFVFERLRIQLFRCWWFSR